MYLTTSRRACSRVGYSGRWTRSFFKAAKNDSAGQGANPCAASRVPDLVILPRPREPGRSVIAAAAAVEYRALGERVIAGGHPDRLLDQRRLAVVIRGPADHHPGMAVDDRGEVKPALPGRNVRNTADELHARLAGGE